MPEREYNPKLLKRDGATIVITGDSMSYNRYDFEHEVRVNAYDCLPGIRSWSFLLRDAIHRNDEWFQHGDEVRYNHLKSNTVAGLPSLPEFALPFDQRSLALEVYDREEEIVLRYIHHNDTDKAVLYLGSVPEDTAARFDLYVDGVFCSTVNNDGAGQPFQGYNPLYIELQAEAGVQHEIKLTNWEQSAACPHSSGKMTAYLLGIGSKYSPVVLTGQGSRTAEWLLDNLAERVTSFHPDLVILIIGANDRVYRTVPQFDHDLRAVVNEIYAATPQTSLLLIMPPSAEHPENPAQDDNVYVPDDKSATYNAVLKAVADQYNCAYIDTPSLFAGVPIEQWRFDSVHFTKYGNRIMARAVYQMLGLDAALLG